jgi:DNA helicase II / ATP-dependent DNA helicase PcrA
MPLSDGVERLLEGLDVEQHDAATKDVGPLCVVAGAGAGKTRTLVARAAYGVEAFGLVPEEVLAISFTNKACGEIAERIREVIGPGGAGIGVRTFHAAAWQMLVSPNRERLGRRSSVSILDGESSKRLCKRAIEDVGRVARGYTPREAQRQIALHKAHLRTPAEIAKTGEAGEVLAWIWLRYKALCRAMSAFDFEDMLAAACHLLEDDDAIRERIQSQVRLLLLDEYQDASPSQRRFARLLSGGEGRNVTGIGDDDQTLYAFRGGDATGLIRFEEDYPGAQSVVLTANYRSLGAIVDAGQKLVTRNAERRRKVLRSALGVGGEITTHVYEDEEEECAAVAVASSSARRARSRRWRARPTTSSASSERSQRARSRFGSWAHRGRSRAPRSKTPSPICSSPTTPTTSSPPGAAAPASPGWGRRR